MSTLEAKMMLLSTIPKEHQKEIQNYLLINFFDQNPYKLLSKNEVLEELAESRLCYDGGKKEDFDNAIDGIGVKYGL